MQIDGQGQKCHVHENTFKFRYFRIYPVFYRLFAIQPYFIKHFAPPNTEHNLCTSLTIMLFTYLEQIRSNISSKQGRSQTSEQDESSLERRRRKPLGGSGCMPLRKILKSGGSEMLF